MKDFVTKRRPKIAYVDVCETWFISARDWVQARLTTDWLKAWSLSRLGTWGSCSVHVTEYESVPIGARDSISVRRSATRCGNWQEARLGSSWFGLSFRGSARLGLAPGSARDSAHGSLRGESLSLARNSAQPSPGVGSVRLGLGPIDGGTGGGGGWHRGTVSPGIWDFDTRMTLWTLHGRNSVASPRGGGASGATYPPPQPPIGHPVRSMQIRGDFRVRKNGVGLQDLLRRFTCTDATADVLWSYDYEKRGSCGMWKLLKE